MERGYRSILWFDGNLPLRGGSLRLEHAVSRQSTSQVAPFTVRNFVLCLVFALLKPAVF
jgi:hypothetical protein